MSSSVAKTVEVASQPSVFRFRSVEPVLALPHVIREGRMTIGPDLAAWILRDAAFAGQRKSAKHHVKLLAHTMTDGRWSAGSQLSFCELDGALYLTNGKHRMNAVVESGIPQEFQVLVNRCRNIAEVEADYHRHDTAARKRSTTEIINSTQMGREAGLPKGLMAALYSAAPILDAGLEVRHYAHDPVSRDVSAKIGAAAGWLTEARRFAELTAPASSTVRAKLFNVGVLAVALMTIRHQPHIAADFWGGLAKDDGLRRTDPRKTLLLDLAARNTGAGSHRQRLIPTAVAWNAFYEARPLHIIKVSESSVLRIAGTSITGRAK